MRILFITQWFQPESFFKGLPFAKALKEKGHDVEVLTGFPNYPGGKLYPGYRIRIYQQEIMDGVKVHRVPLYPSHDKSAFRRIANYMSLSLSAFLMGPWLIKKPDIIYVYNLVTLGLPAFFLRFLHGSRVIIDVQDLWPESVTGSGMLRNKHILHFLNSICNLVYSKADQLIVLSPGFKDYLVNRGLLPEKIKVIYNWCYETSVRHDSHDARADYQHRKFVILFAGTMGTVQGLDTLLKCAEICQTEMPEAQFLLIGAGVDRSRLVRLKDTMKLDNVTFLPYRPKDHMPEIYDMADVVLVHLKDHPLFRITIPSKTQAYLYMGKPIIMAVRGDAANLVQKAGAGIVCEPDNPRAMADAIKALRNAGYDERYKMGRNGNQFYMQNLSFYKGLESFEDLMLKLIENY